MTKNLGNFHGKGIIFAHIEPPSLDLNLYRSILTLKECDGSRTITVKYITLTLNPTCIF